MLPDETDTIAAVATALQSSARGVVRLSGPNSLAVVESVVKTTPPVASLTTGSRRLEGRLTLALEDREREVAVGLYVWPNHQSYTGQPSVELHLPGSPPLLEAALDTLCRCGARLATPGEFTLRAFMAGRLDLTEAEAVLGVIDARSDTDLETALNQLAGGLSAPLMQLREEMLQLLAELEAGLDFVEEEDVRFIEVDELTSRLAVAADRVRAIAEQMHSRDQAIALPRVVLVGPANAGKSSLFNALAGDARDGNARDNNAMAAESAAIVSAEAGTTRDTLSKLIRHGGSDFELIDTAGILETESSNLSENGSIDALADELRDRMIGQAALVLHCQPSHLPLKEWGAGSLRVLTKCDLLPEPSQYIAPSKSGDAITTSVETGLGLADLLTAIVATLDREQGEVIPSTATRCRDSLHEAASSLASASQLAPQGDDELVASEIRAALNSLGQVVGAVATDDILDRIFGQFCIGK